MPSVKITLFSCRLCLFFFFFKRSFCFLAYIIVFVFFSFKEDFLCFFGFARPFVFFFVFWFIVFFSLREFSGKETCFGGKPKVSS